MRLSANPTYVRIRSGTYAPASEWAALRPWERYAIRVRGYAEQHPDAVFVLESAAVLHGLPVFGEPRFIHVLALSGVRSHRYGDVVIHSCSDTRRVVQVDGALATSPDETAVDLMRVLPPAFAIAVGDAVISPRQRGRSSIAELRELAAEHKNRRGRARLAEMWDQLDPRSESTGESVSRAIIGWLGFARPECQVEFRSEGRTDRADFVWPDVRVIGESDGYGKYVAETPQETASRMIDEKSREDRLRRQSDAFVRWDWGVAMAHEPLRQRLLAAGVPLVFPRRAALLQTLASNPRSLPPTGHAGAGAGAGGTLAHG